MTELTQAQLDQLYTDWSQLGADRERERIIKLIEDNMMGRDSWLDVIELIKGEQK